MRARAALVAEVDPRGRTVCTELRSDPPLTLRQGLDGVQLVGSSAGPLQGDDLSLSITVGAGASLAVGSVAAMLVHPGVVDAPSALTYDVRVGTGGSLCWRPEPTVLVRGCDHEGTTRLHLAPGVEVVWREEVVVGRHGEAGGSARLRLVADLDGVPLLRNDLVIGPRWPGSLGPAGLAGMRAVGSVLVVGERSVEAVNARASAVVPPEGVRRAVMPLSGPAVLVTAVAPSVPDLRAALDAVLASKPVRAPSA